MDNKKKEKLVAIILTTLVSLAASVTACLLGVSPDAITDIGAEAAGAVSVCAYLD